MGGRKVLSLFWWCPKKVKHLKWRMNTMLESSDKKDIFKHKKNHTCPACRAQSALSHSQFSLLRLNTKTSKRMRWGDDRSSTDWQTKGKKKFKNLSRWCCWTDWTQSKMMRVDELDRVYCVPSCTRVYCAMKLDQLSKNYSKGKFGKSNEPPLLDSFTWNWKYRAKVLSNKFLSNKKKICLKQPHIENV